VLPCSNFRPSIASLPPAFLLLHLTLPRPSTDFPFPPFLLFGCFLTLGFLNS
jgi:hypothetical protein